MAIDTAKGGRAKLLGANKERLHVAERHLSIWILHWGSTSASLSTADMSGLYLEPVRWLLSRLRDEDHPPQQAASADAASADVTGR